jgi:hypothetical protein
MRRQWPQFDRGKNQEACMDLFRILCVCVVLTTASVSFGQSLPKVETSMGYSFLRERPSFDRQGWVASTTANVTPWFGVKGEIGGNYTDTSHRDVHSFLGGAQFTIRKSQVLTPWGQFLIGAVRTGDGATITNLSAVITKKAYPVILPATRTDIEFQPGAGVDMWLHPAIGIRVGADYRRLLGTSYVDSDSFRAQFGVVFRMRSGTVSAR